MSKVFKKVMHPKLTKHLEEHYLFDKEQHGFRKNKSTITTLITFVESVIELLDKNKVAGIFMDLSKAFDSISHSKMIENLNN